MLADPTQDKSQWRAMRVVFYTVAILLTTAVEEVQRQTGNRS